MISAIAQQVCAPIAKHAGRADRRDGDLGLEIDLLRDGGWLKACLPVDQGGAGWGTEPDATESAFDALRVDDAVALPGVGGVVEHDAIVGRHRGQNRLCPAAETSATVRDNATDRNLQIRLPHQAIYSEVGPPVGSLIAF